MPAVLGSTRREQDEGVTRCGREFMSKSEIKTALEQLHDENAAELKTWEHKLEEATNQVGYWKSQLHATSVLCTRATVESWTVTPKH